MINIVISDEASGLASHGDICGLVAECHKKERHRYDTTYWFVVAVTVGHVSLNSRKTPTTVCNLPNERPLLPPSALPARNSLNFVRGSARSPKCIARSEGHHESCYWLPFHSIPFHSVIVVNIIQSENVGLPKRTSKWRENPRQK